MVFFFKQKTAYEMRISDWSSDVCSSDLSASSGRTSGRNTAASAMLKAVWALTTRRAPSLPNTDSQQIGRASCRERVCQYVSISVVAVSLKKTLIRQITYTSSPEHAAAHIGPMSHTIERRRPDTDI